jgi:hypothetical protein
MNQQVIIGFATEGTTDTRFLGSIIQRSFENAAFECKSQIEILPIQHIEKQIGLEFIDAVRAAAQKAWERGVMILCVHTDADGKDDSIVFKHKFDPLFEQAESWPHEKHCRNLVAVVPVQMTEAWMLADAQLLKEELGTQKSNVELGIHKNPEDYGDPKDAIKNAIRISRQKETKRRRKNLKIDELYSSIGQKLGLATLNSLKSYRKFMDSVKAAYQKMGYM